MPEESGAADADASVRAEPRAGPKTQTKTVAITGASAGVGRAVARACGRRGWNVGLIARRTEGLEAARREIEDAGGRAIALPLDVSDADAVEEAADRIERELGPIDVWINIAMATIFSPFADVTADEFRRVTEVTYLGQVYGTMAALRRMRRRNRGMIVQVGSALAYRAIPLQSAYCGAKFAIRGFTDALRSELIHDKSNIHLSMVQLPAVNTPQFDWARNKMPRRAQPVPPIFQPEAVAAAILHAVDEAPRELWIGWPAIKAILGNMAVPGWIDGYLARTCYSGQQTNEPVDPDRKDNLFSAVPGDFGAHGRFDDRSSSSLYAASSETVRMLLLSAGIGIGLAALGGAFAAGRASAVNGSSGNARIRPSGRNRKVGRE
jgi:short-subunit dehydrogenase